jgi:hypothetical protein
MAFRQLDNRQLRQFRSDVSALKKAGVVRSSIKVKSALPSSTSNGQRLDELVRKYKSATPSGGNAAKIVVTTPTQANAYRKLGYVTDARRGSKPEHVLVPIPKGAKVTVDKSGEIRVHEVNGIETVHLPVPYHNLTQYIEGVMSDAKAINAMKERNEAFGFQFYGNNSKKAFGTIQALFNYLTGYESVEPLLDKAHSKEAREMVQNLVIVKSPTADMYEWTGKARRERLRKSLRVNRTKPEQHGKWDNAARRAEWPKWRQEQYREKKRMQAAKSRQKGKKK